MKKKIPFLFVTLTILLLLLAVIANKSINLKTTDKTTYKEEYQEDNEIEIDEGWYTDWEYEIEDSYINLKKYNGEETNYVLPAKATISGVEYTTKLVGEELFASSTITDLKISDGVIIENMGNLFKNSNVQNLDCSNMDLSYRTDMSFLDGSTYKNLNLSNSDMSNVVAWNFHYTFNDTELVDFSNANLKSLKRMNGLFTGAHVDTVTFENVKLESIEDVGNMFAPYSTINNIILKNAEFTNYQYNFGYLIERANVTYADFSGISLPKASGMYNMLYNSPTLKKADVSYINAPLATSTGHMFENDYVLEEVIMDGFDAPKTFNSFRMFYNCQNLKSVTIDGVQLLEGIITPYMEEITIKNATEINKDFTWDCKETGENVCNIKKITFENIKTIKNQSVIKLPQLDDITIIGDTTVEQFAFYYKAQEYQPAWGQYYDEAEYRFLVDRYMPVRKLTKVTTDNYEVLKYNWEKDNRFISDYETHNLVYKYNDETTEDLATTFTAGDKVTLEVPTRDTYIFQGWNTEEDGSGKLYVPGEILYVNADVTLYAQWKRTIYDDETKMSGWLGESVKWRYESSDYTVYVYPADENSDGRTYDYMDLDDSAIALPQQVCYSQNIVFEEGITYIGKYLLKQCGKVKVVLPESLEEIGDGAFYMNMSQLEGFNPSIKTGVTSFAWVNIYYTVTIDANGGSFTDDTTQKTQQFKTGYIYYRYNYQLGYSTNNTSNGFTVEFPEKEGYKFVEFNTKADGTGDKVACIENSCILTLPYDTTIYAIYEKDKITINYNAGAGDFNTENEELYYNDPITSEVPTKEGYIFAEWNTKEDGTGEVIFAGQENYFKESITLYAIYQKEYELTLEERLGYADSANRVILDDGEEVRLIPFTGEWGTTSHPMVHEVSKEYIKTYGDYKYINFGEETYDELITLIATFSESNEGGLFDTLNCPEDFYDKYYSMAGQFTGRIFNPYKHTSNGGYERYMHEFRFRFVWEHWQQISKKYRLRVFTSGKEIWVGISPIEAEVTVAKVDDKTNEQLEGATLFIYNDEGRFVDYIITTLEKTTLNLPVGQTYRIIEYKAPDGYGVAEDIVFTVNVEDTNESIVMKDENLDGELSESLITNPNTIDRIKLLVLLVIASAIMIVYLKNNKPKRTFE